MTYMKWPLCAAMICMTAWVCVVGFMTYGCGENPTGLPVDRTAAGRDERSPVDLTPLVDYLCGQFPAWCETHRVIPHIGEPIPDNAVIVTFGGDYPAQTYANGSWKEVGICDPLEDIHCWLDYSYAYPIWRCTFGDCPKPPVCDD